MLSYLIQIYVVLSHTYIFMLGFQSSRLDLGITHSIHTHILLHPTIGGGGDHQNGGLTKAKPYIKTPKTPFLDIYSRYFRSCRADLSTLLAKLMGSANTIFIEVV